MKFLVIRLSSIGDIVLTTPVVRCLKKQVVTAEVHYLTKAAFGAILEPNPYIDKVHTVQDNLDEVIETLKLEDFDYVIDLHHNLRTLKIKRALGKKSYSFNKLNIEKWLYVNSLRSSLPEVHIVDRYMDTVEPFGVQNDGGGLDFFIPEEDRVKTGDIPASHHAGYVGVVIGAALNTKKLPPHKLKELCDTIDHPVILLGGKEDRETGELIAAVDPFKIYNACGKFSINESADLVRRAKVIVSHDTGLMHIAAAFNKPIISIWGNTVPEFGMYPYYAYKSDGGRHTGIHSGATGINKPYDIIEVKNLRCRPCSKIGYKKCPLKHFKCMELHRIEEIVDKLKQRLGRI
jgi:ADP-heptose:LPS heptosyltransferase